jgi:PEP-CTERM motif
MQTSAKFEDRAKSWLLAGALATVVDGWLSLAPVGAAVLNPGDTGIAPDALKLTVAEHDGPLASIDNSPLITPSFSGFYSESVVRNQTNVWGAGDLTWIINVSVDKGSTDALVRDIVDSFAGFDADVGYDTGFPHGGIPTTADRLTAATIGFNFVPGISGGEESAHLEIDTNATQFTSGSLSINPDTSGPQIPAFGFAPFAPPPTVPEPSTWSLMGLGFAGLGLFKIAKSRRRGELHRLKQRRFSPPSQRLIPF